MTEQTLIEYIANCAWQIPLLAAGAWVMVKVVRPPMVVQYWLWVSVLLMAVFLPTRGIETTNATQRQVTDQAAFLRGVAMDEAERREASMSVQPVVGSPVRQRGIRLSETATHWMVWIYSATVAFGALRFLQAWLAARRLVKGSREVTITADGEAAFAEYGRRLDVALPELRESSEIAGPVVVGAINAVLLLPESFLAHPEEEVGAALCHELAHVRRRDYLANLLCQTVVLPIFWHPAAHLVQQRIRRTREMVCDAIAAEEMESNADYARSLLSLATQMLKEGERSQAVGLFENGTMEERVMKLTERVSVMSGWTKVVRIASGAAAMAAVTMAAATFHVRTTLAETTASTQSAPPTVAAQSKPTAQVAAPAAAVEAAKPDRRPTMIARGRHGTVSPREGDYVHNWKSADGEPFTMVNRDPQEPTDEEKNRVEMQLSDSRQLVDAETVFFADPKVELKLDELQKNLGSVDFQKQMDKASKAMNDPAFKKQMEEMQKNLPRLTAQANLAAAQALKGNIDLQMKLDDLKNLQPKIDMKQFKIQADGFNGDKFRITMDSGMKDADEQMAKAQKELESGEMQRKLEAAEQMLQDVKRQMEQMQAK